MPRSINDVLGAFGFWHEIEGAPDGSPEQRAALLEEAYRRQRDLPATNAPFSAVQAAAMTLELAVHFSQQHRPLPEALVRLLGMLMGLPDDFLDDPSDVFLGQSNVGRPPSDPRARELAMWHDRIRWIQTGKLWPLSTLANQIQQDLGSPRPTSRDTIRQWRKQADYQDFVQGTFIAPEGTDRLAK